MDDIVSFSISGFKALRHKTIRRRRSSKRTQIRVDEPKAIEVVNRSILDQIFFHVDPLMEYI